MCLLMAVAPATAQMVLSLLRRRRGASEKRFRLAA
jgi:hypothetical protein